MRKDDAGNTWVVVAFSILSVVDAFFFLFTLYRLRRVRRVQDHSRHLEVLHVTIAAYCLCTCHLVRILWYLDVLAHYPLQIYLVLEDLPILAMFSAYSTISCLW